MFCKYQLCRLKQHLASDTRLILSKWFENWILPALMLNYYVRKDYQPVISVYKEGEKKLNILIEVHLGGFRHHKGFGDLFF